MTKRVSLNNVILIATKSKLRRLRQLRIDTGDEKLDVMFPNYLTVVADYMEKHGIKKIT